jgi:hypothetical protein
MGIWKDAVTEANGPVKGQVIAYTDRDAPRVPHELESKQLDLPFESALVPKGSLPRIKTRAELDAEYDETFNNFKIVLNGQDVSADHKQTVLITLLNNYRSGNPYLSSRSQSLLLEILRKGLGV